MTFATTIIRISKMAIISLWRNRWLSVVAVLVMAMTIFTISFFSSLIITIDRTANSLKDKVDIIVYFDDSASKEQIFSVQNTLYARSDVKSVVYVSKEEALSRWKIMVQNNANIKDVVTDEFNPLPRSLNIKTAKSEDLENVYQFLQSSDYKPLIRSISYQENRALIQKLIRITTFVKIIGWTLSLIFALISILFIYNIIMLTIYARSEEISIMRLVGASDWYIQGPFLIEGIAYGLIASIISASFLSITLKLLMPSAQSYLGATSTNIIFSGFSFWIIILVQILIGVSLGAACSAFAIKKHLK